MGGVEGNYAAYGLVDLLAGTSLGSDVLDDVRDEAEKRNVDGRVGKKARELGRKAKKGARKAGRDRSGSDE